MAKLKKLSFHSTDDVPDHVLEEMTNFATQLGLLIQPLVDSVDPNIAMSGMNWVHAAILKKLISDVPGELEKASKIYAYSFIKNVELLINQNNMEQK